jgi:Flp pilus assembly protein TadG
MRCCSDLRRDAAGVTAVEFAMIAPVLLMMLFGMFDIGQGMYTKALLQGAIEKAARDSTIEAAVTGTLDARVTAIVSRIAPGAAVTFNRKSYTHFTKVRQPEDWTDGGLLDGVCNNGEIYQDANGNGAWDADRGRTGNGSARDAIVYKVTVTYPRMFPVARFAGLPANMTLTATSVLRNQPYGIQSGATTLRPCP